MVLAIKPTFSSWISQPATLPEGKPPGPPEWGDSLPAASDLVGMYGGFETIRSSEVHGVMVRRIQPFRWENVQPVFICFHWVHTKKTEYHLFGSQDIEWVMIIPKTLESINKKNSSNRSLAAPANVGLKNSGKKTFHLLIIIFHN